MTETVEIRNALLCLPGFLVYDGRYPFRYKVTGLSLADACEYNSNVARNLARPQIALTWVGLYM
jgi:hypothetical protein